MIGAFVTGTRWWIGGLGVINGLRTILAAFLLVGRAVNYDVIVQEIYYFSSNNNAEILLLLAFLMGVHRFLDALERPRTIIILPALTGAIISIGFGICCIITPRSPKTSVPLNSN
ncbi:hypothetical protein LZ023_34805 (plasmid) [Pseudomonas silvicola]|nr:hypothetical protein LZ023_34805 [Pseudomonas silvicola]